MIETNPWTGRLPSISMVAGSCALVPYTDTRPMAQQLKVATGTSGFVIGKQESKGGHLRGGPCTF